MSAHRHRLHLLLGVMLLVLVAALVHRGGSFYVLSLEQRVEHRDYRVLRPSGIVGNGYGVVALALIVLNLAYLVRRHLASVRLGPMRVWLDLHVFTGLAAAVLAAFHSAFQLRSPIAQASAASLFVVVLTGLAGRFFHALGPGDEKVRLRLALDALAAAVPGRHEAIAIALHELPPPAVPPNASLLRSLAAIPRWRQVARARRGAIAMLAPPRAEQDGTARQALRLLVRASDAEARAAGMAALVRSWRGLHRFFALLMLVAVGLHAGVAWYFGYRWIFS